MPAWRGLLSPSAFVEVEVFFVADLEAGDLFGDVVLPAADDAEEEFFRIMGLKIVPHLGWQFLEAAELAEFLQHGADLIQNCQSEQYINGLRRCVIMVSKTVLLSSTDTLEDRRSYEAVHDERGV